MDDMDNSKHFTYDAIIALCDPTHDFDYKLNPPQRAHFQERFLYSVGCMDGSWIKLTPKEWYTARYKFHISVDPVQLADAWNAIAPIAVNEGLNIKYAMPETAQRLMKNDNIQRGKMIVISADYCGDNTPYPRNWPLVLGRIMHALKDHHIRPGPEVLDDYEIDVKTMPHMLYCRDEHKQRRENLEYKAPLSDLSQAKDNENPFAMLKIDPDTKENKEPIPLHTSAQMRLKRCKFKLRPFLLSEIQELSPSTFAGTKWKYQIDVREENYQRLNHTLLAAGMNMEAQNPYVHGKWTNFSYRVTFTEEGYQKLLTWANERAHSRVAVNPPDDTTAVGI